MAHLLYSVVLKHYYLLTLFKCFSLKAHFALFSLMQVDFLLQRFVRVEQKVFRTKIVSNKIFRRRRDTFGASRDKKRTQPAFESYSFLADQIVPFSQKLEKQQRRTGARPL
jgi:hypothetical protein